MKNRILKVSLLFIVFFATLFLAQRLEAKDTFKDQKTAKNINSNLNESFWSSNQEHIFNSNSGNVGIGLSLPTEKLEINGNILSDNFKTINLGQTLVGKGAGEGISKNLNYITALGYQAAYQNTGNQQTALGYQAGYKNTGNTTVSLGYLAGRENTGHSQIALGHQAGSYNNGNNQTAIGYNTGAYNQADYQTVFGTAAGVFNTGARQLAIGINSGQSNTGYNQLALGFSSGVLNSGDNLIAIGYEAGINNQLNNQFILQQSNINNVPLIQGNFLNGNVAIGTTEALARLHVKSGNANIAYHYDPGDMIIESSNDTTKLDIVFPHVSTGLIQFYAGQNVISSIAASQSMYGNNLYIGQHKTHQGQIDNIIFSADGVGINEGSPAATLHVNGTIRGQHQASNGQSGLTKSYNMKDASGANCKMHFIDGLLVESNCLEASNNPNPPLR